MHKQKNANLAKVKAEKKAIAQDLPGWEKRIKGIYQYGPGDEDGGYNCKDGYCYSADEKEKEFGKNYLKWTPEDLKEVKISDPVTFQALFELAELANNKDAGQHRIQAIRFLTKMAPEYYKEHGGAPQFAKNIIEVQKGWELSYAANLDPAKVAKDYGLVMSDANNGHKKPLETAIIDAVKGIKTSITMAA